MKLLEWLTNFIAWLQIAASVTFFGLIAGLVVYGVFPTTAGKVLGVVIAAAGLVTGIIFATRVWKKQGTINFISRVSASPELDNLEDGRP